MTPQVEDVSVPARVQTVGLNVPEPVLAKDTAPVGVALAPDEVSVTVAVHVEEEPTFREEGEHVRLVEVLLTMVWAPFQSVVPCESEDAPPPMSIESDGSWLSCALPANPHAFP